MVNFGLDFKDIQKIQTTLKHYPCVDTAIIFGSRAKGNYRKGSDIDLTLLGKNITHQDLLTILFDLDELLLPYTFDLSLYNELYNDELKKHIQRVGKIFYKA